MNEQLRAPLSEEAIASAIREKIKFLLEKKKINRMLEVNDRIADRLKALEEEYPDARRCYLFHVLSGSTIERQICSSFDFPGEDSLVKMTEDLYQEYQKKE
ncbi:hypothetical protein A3H09_00385 [Candidatus Falkowbacteria bacterium RIFCSPLOWO2_12_FULL_45_13]|uniref:Uncharacterized protein n=2 Tax=Candidatus Falkowiibacteriota TaxID=1752728 RepID=A0A1F5SAA9_9BACT|nr:MAG: hypothetical protein A3H66_02720 [Candidatus Falkowbacteria bacterium RIFCSPLOWO2_02_FULL_45_21]OGF30719.1 MAG: hypothetical protein A3H09_00385 [Candidatus Falkowbacteria bacterium RIFCSPLOWO2_12_FULL_45_13]